MQRRSRTGLLFLFCFSAGAAKLNGIKSWAAYTHTLPSVTTNLEIDPHLTAVPRREQQAVVLDCAPARVHRFLAIEENQPLNIK